MNKSRPSTRSHFFIIIGVIALLVVLAGFGVSFIYPSWKGTFSAPVSIYIHGALAFTWVLLFFLQALLVGKKRLRIHMQLGKVGIFVAAGILISMIPVGLYTVRRDLDAGHAAAAYSVIVGAITAGIFFFLFVLLAIVWRRKPVYHKRLMVLATIVLLWPAWFRLRHYFPSVPRPDIWFALVMADSLILFAWAWDWIKHRRIHPSWLYGGLFIIAEQSLEVALYDSPGWRSLGHSLYSFFSTIA